MDIQVLASGSSGNCYKVSDRETALLIECGINFRSIKEKLDFDLSDIAACLISHSHKDHCKSWKDVAKAGIDLYMTAETAAELKAEHHRTHCVFPKQRFSVGSMVVVTFQVQHDCPGSIGFVIQSRNTGDKLVYLTDTYYSRYVFPGMNYLMIECNHDQEILKQNIENGAVPKSLGLRLLESHFNIENVKDFLKANDLSQLRSVYLIHMSKTNSDPERFRREIQEITGVPVYT